MGSEKVNLEMALTECQIHLKKSEPSGARFILRNQKINSRRLVLAELESANIRKAEAESQLKVVKLELGTLCSSNFSSEKEVEKERKSSSDSISKCKKLENERTRMESESKLQRLAIVEEFRINQSHFLRPWVTVTHNRMAQVRPRNGAHGHVSFAHFFEQWLTEQNQHLETLVSASKENEEQLENGKNGRAVTQEELDAKILRPLIERVIQHYEQYYGAKSNWAKTDILSMFNPSWRSSLEDAFLWIGGWRPSMAFHLLYSKSGQQVEAKLMELIQGLSTGDLGDLSSDQLDKVNESQKRTIRAEKDLTEKLAKRQESVADSSMVELSHAATELMRGGEEAEDARVDAALDPKKEALVEILQKADDLRLKTLKQVLQILNPIQSVHFLVAAAELHLRFHEWGKKRDERNREAAEVGGEPRNT